MIHSNPTDCSTGRLTTRGREGGTDRTHRRDFDGAAAILLNLAVVACGGSIPLRLETRAPESARLEECVQPGIQTPVQCGTLRVLEDADRAEGRRIDLNLIVVPAAPGERSREALFLLAGGPGQAATEQLAMVEQLRALDRGRDLVLVDQRGTGRSNPLVCGSGDWLDDARNEVGQLTDAGRSSDCLVQLASHADVRFYTTAQAVRDLEAVRATLGYERLDLIGVSYGTRVAQHYLRAYPGRVRSMVLRAVAPLDFNIPVEGSIAAQAALDGVVEDCAADWRCAAAYPELERDLYELLEEAAVRPQSVQLRDPVTGDTVTVRVTRERLESTLNVLLLGPTQRSIPLLVSRAATEGVQTLAPILAQVLAAVYGPLPTGMYLSVVCTEDVPRITADGVKRASRSFLKAVAPLQDACASWPSGELPADFHDPAISDVPVLLISGEADPATTPAVAERARQYLRRSWHVVVPATAHGPVFPGCVGDLVREFFEQASGEGLEFGCVGAIVWPEFTLPPLAGG